jgi:hypothetical protein
VIAEGKMTGSLPGKVLRGQGYINPQNRLDSVHRRQ